MLETRFRTRRAMPLAAHAKSADSSGIEIRPATAEARLSLRVGLADGGAAAVAGLPLDAAINTVATIDDRWIARLGPDEWLVGGTESDADLIHSQLSEALSGRAHSIVDVSHRNVGIDVSGEHAATALNAGCPLDLGEAAFPPGSATRTLLGKAEIVLLRSGILPSYRVECWRSFAGYVHTFLAEAAFGLGAAQARPAR